MKKSSSYINTILFILLIVLVLCYFGIFKFTYSESFGPGMNNNYRLNPGAYPNSSDKPILYGDYNVKQNTGVTKNNNYNIWKDYPVYPSSYKQQTNNKRYWSTPDNGTCSPAEFCGTPYSPTNIKINKVTPGLPIGASGVTRVNWWAGKK
jgi:hypothetical protein